MILFSFAEMLGFGFLMYSAHLGVSQGLNIEQSHYIAAFSAMLVYLFVWIIGYSPTYTKQKSIKDMFKGE